jgi:hypothetical protein
MNTTDRELVAKALAHCGVEWAAPRIQSGCENSQVIQTPLWLMARIANQSIKFQNIKTEVGSSDASPPFFFPPTTFTHILGFLLLTHPASSRLSTNHPLCMPSSLHSHSPLT